MSPKLCTMMCVCKNVNLEYAYKQILVYDEHCINTCMYATFSGTPTKKKKMTDKILFYRKCIMRGALEESMPILKK